MTRPVAILFRRIGPYHRARLNAAARRFPSVAVELTASDRVYAWDPVEAPELSRVTIFQDAAAATGAQVAQRVAKTLDQLSPRAVAIPGWSTPFALAALRWCGVSRTPAIVMSESREHDTQRSWRAETLKRRLVGLFSAALAGGAPQLQYLRRLGMPEDRIFLGYDVVDNGHFARGAAAARKDAAETRRHLGLPPKYFLASSRFIAKKNLTRLLQAYARYRQFAPGKRWKLALLGEGPMRQAVLEQAQALELGHDLLLPGFIQYDRLPYYYGLASVFIHASTVEQWGLVVNEAMAAGLPVLVSAGCGCAPDLVQNGVNGYAFDPLDTEGLARLMAQVADSGAGIARMGEASRRIASEWAPDRFGHGLEQALRIAAPPPARLGDGALLHLLLTMRRAAVAPEGCQ
ncbi:MAG TPA: glycosyltransferase [Bryobacteraceae bacterium]|nr:glycosyltransferase [Bryobacteraceae bacterium]